MKPSTDAEEWKSLKSPADTIGLLTEISQQHPGFSCRDNQSRDAIHERQTLPNQPAIPNDFVSHHHSSFII
jgi:hypothetical protein